MKIKNVGILLFILTVGKSVAVVLVSIKTCIYVNILNKINVLIGRTLFWQPGEPM